METCVDHGNELWLLPVTFRVGRCTKLLMGSDQATSLALLLNMYLAEPCVPLQEVYWRISAETDRKLVDAILVNYTAEL